MHVHMPIIWAALGFQVKLYAQALHSREVIPTFFLLGCCSNLSWRIFFQHSGELFNSLTSQSVIILLWEEVAISATRPLDA